MGSFPRILPRKGAPMRLHYINPGFDYSLDSIMLFETGEQSEF